MTATQASGHSTGQTVEQYLFEQLEKIAPGRYTKATALQLFKNKLRFPCSHLKGGRYPAALRGVGKDFNLSTFTFPDGVTEIKCLYNCGLKVRTDNPKTDEYFNELYDLPTTNVKASAEVMHPRKDPGPVPTYSDEYRERIRRSNDLFLDSVYRGLESGRIKPGDKILGGTFPHPDPIEAPDTIIERGIKKGHAIIKSRKAAIKAIVVAVDKFPELEPKAGPGPIKKIRKRKTQSRRKRGGK